MLIFQQYILREQIRMVAIVRMGRSSSTELGEHYYVDQNIYAIDNSNCIYRLDIPRDSKKFHMVENMYQFHTLPLDYKRDHTLLKHGLVVSRIYTERLRCLRQRNSQCMSGKHHKVFQESYILQAKSRSKKMDRKLCMRFVHKFQEQLRTEREAMGKLDSQLTWIRRRG